MLLTTALSFVLICIGFCSLSLNILLIVIVWKSPLLGRKGQPVFIHIFSILIGKSLQLSIILFYVTPSVLYQEYPLNDTDEGEFLLSVVSYAFYLFWVHSCCSNTALAFSRFIMLISPDSTMSIACASRFSVFCQALGIWLFAAVFSFITQAILPCCRVEISPATYGYAYATPPSISGEPAFNYSQLYVNLPANILHTVIFCFFYASIVIHLWRRRSPQTTASRREMELAIQFFCIALFFSLTWICFNFFPFTVLRSMPATVMLECDCGAAALIYLTMNLLGLCEKALYTRVQNTSLPDRVELSVKSTSSRLFYVKLSCAIFANTTRETDATRGVDTAYFCASHHIGLRRP